MDDNTNVNAAILERAGPEKLLEIMAQQSKAPDLKDVFKNYVLSREDIGNIYEGLGLNTTIDANLEEGNIVDVIQDRLEKLINIVRSIREEVAAPPTNNASSGAIAGLPPDSPPVKKKKKYIYGGHGSRKMWLANKKK